MAADTTEKASHRLNTGSSRDNNSDLALFEALKPYLGHCLTLNHDLNNPLAGILGYAEFLKVDGDLSEEQMNNVDQIITCAERIKVLVEALCEHKISVSEEIDLGPVIEAYKKIEGKLD